LFRESSKKSTTKSTNKRRENTNIREKRIDVNSQVTTETVNLTTAPTQTDALSESDSNDKNVSPMKKRKNRAIYDDDVNMNPDKTKAQHLRTSLRNEVSTHSFRTDDRMYQPELTSIPGVKCNCLKGKIIVLLSNIGRVIF